MLKVKDNVDLKELEKYGFKKENDEYRFSIPDTINNYQEKDLTINKYGYLYLDFINSFCGMQVPEIIYDLIKADLVEKSD